MLEKEDLEEIKKMIEDSNKQVSKLMEESITKGIHKEKDIPTKAIILAIKDPIKRQKMIAENMELFRN